MSIKTFNDLKAPWFHMRGSCVYDVKNEWQNSQFVTVLDAGDYTAGDNYVLECAKHFKTDAAWKDYFNKSGNFGTTARGELSFGDAFGKLLKCHRMALDSKTAAPGGITFNGYNSAVSSIESRGKGGIVLGTYIVGRLALSLSKDWASVRVGYYDIPCLGSGENVVSCRIRETDFSIRRPHKPGGAGVVETDEEIIVKFLKFALSLSDLSFPNVCEVYVYCGQPVNGRISMDQISEGLAKATEKKTPYANPNIFYDFRCGAQTMKTQFLLRPLSDELTEVLRNCKYQPCFFGKTNNRYWGDYLVSRAMQTPFDYGKTVEETAINCIKYCIDHRWANYPESLVGEDVGGTTNAQELNASSLLDMEDAAVDAAALVESEPELAINLAALADVDWSLMDEDETETTAFVGDVSVDDFGEWTEEDDFGEWTDEDEFAEDEEDVVAMFDSVENDVTFNPLPAEYEDLDSHKPYEGKGFFKSVRRYDDSMFSISKSEIKREREKFRGRTCDEITGADIKTKKDLVAFMRRARREIWARDNNRDNAEYCLERYMVILLSSVWWNNHRCSMVDGKFKNVCDLLMHTRPRDIAYFVVIGYLKPGSDIWLTKDEISRLSWKKLEYPIRFAGYCVPQCIADDVTEFCKETLGLSSSDELVVQVAKPALEDVAFANNPQVIKEIRKERRQRDQELRAKRRAEEEAAALEAKRKAEEEAAALEAKRKAREAEEVAAREERHKAREAEEVAAREERRKAREAEDLARKQARAEEERKRQAERDARKAKQDAEYAARKAKRQQEQEEYEAKKARKAAGEAAFDAWKRKWGIALGKIILKHRNIFATYKGQPMYWANPYALVAHILVQHVNYTFDYPNVEVAHRGNPTISRMQPIRDREYKLAADQIYRFCDDFCATFADACNELSTLEVPSTRSFSVNAVYRNAKSMQDDFPYRPNNVYSSELKRLPGFKRYGLPLFKYAHNTAKNMCYIAKNYQPTIL